MSSVGKGDKMNDWGPFLSHLPSTGLAVVGMLLLCAATFIQGFSTEERQCMAILAIGWFLAALFTKP